MVIQNTITPIDTYKQHSKASFPEVFILAGPDGSGSLIEALEGQRSIVPASRRNGCGSVGLSLALEGLGNEDLTRHPARFQLTDFTKTHRKKKYQKERILLLLFFYAYVYSIRYEGDHAGLPVH
jgi:hypothetical protein